MRLALMLAHALAYSRVVLGKSDMTSLQPPQGTYKAPTRHLQGTYTAPTMHLQVATRSEPAAETRTSSPSHGRSGLGMRSCGPPAGAAEGPLPAQPARRQVQSWGARCEPPGGPGGWRRATGKRARARPLRGGRAPSRHAAGLPPAPRAGCCDWARPPRPPGALWEFEQLEMPARAPARQRTASE
jgi:hypothetical protein